MASAKLEILISAKETATRTMGAVRAAFQARADQIRGIGDGLVKHGEKVEKFLHGVSLLKLATETESVKSALDSVSPSLQKFTSNMLNAGLAVGGTLSLLKDMAHLSKVGGAGSLFGVGAIAAGTVAIGQSYLDMKDEQRGTAESGNRLAVSAANSGKNARSESQFKAAMDTLSEAILSGVPGAAEMALELQSTKTSIIAANKARDEYVANLKAQSEQIRAETKQIYKDHADRAKVRAILAERQRQTPAGQMAEFQNVTRNLADFKAMQIDPEAKPGLWLEREKQVALITEQLEALNKGPIGKVKDLFGAIGSRVQGIMRPGKAPTTTVTSLGTLQGSPILGDALSRQGLFSGGNRANPLTGLTERTLTSIDSGTKQQIQLLRDIWKAVTTGQTAQFGE